MREQVRECLLRPPQPDRLYVLRPGTPEGRQLRKARATHRLEAGEELMAWQWSKLMGALSTFSYTFTAGGPRSGPDVSELVIDGPVPWRSPNADSSAELIADDLNRLKALAAD